MNQTQPARPATNPCAHLLLQRRPLRPAAQVDAPPEAQGGLQRRLLLRDDNCLIWIGRSIDRSVEEWVESGSIQCPAD